MEISSRSKMDVNLTNEDYYLLTAEKKLRKIIEEEKCRNIKLICFALILCGSAILIITFGHIFLSYTFYDYEV